MSAPFVFLGDELSAAGFRLAGVDARAPLAGAEASTLEQAMREASVVLLGARCAAALPPSLLETALAALSPLVILVPEWDGSRLAADPAERVRRALGLEL